MKNILVVMVCAALLSGCGSEKGTLSVTIWGEEYIEQGVPPLDAAGNGVFVDGWSINFDEFVVAVSNIWVQSAQQEAFIYDSSVQLVDLSKPGPHDIGTWLDVNAAKYEQFGYAIEPSTDAVSLNANEMTAKAMRDSAYSVFIRGRASKDGALKSFNWGLNTRTRYGPCQDDAGASGVVIQDNKTSLVQLTIHADHLWYDDLQNPDAAVRFQPMADADANNDGDISWAELKAVPLSRLPLGTYGTGSVAGVKNLADFVAALSGTIGHFQGEGECLASRRE